MRHTDKCRRWALLVDTVTHNSASTTQSEAVAWEPLSSTPLSSFPVPSLPALGPRAPPAERGPSLKSIYRVSLTADLCEGNNIISLKRIISPQPVAGPQKRKKNPGALGNCPVCPLVKTALQFPLHPSCMSGINFLYIG